MGFLEFYSQHFTSLTVIFITVIVVFIGIIIYLSSIIKKSKSIKTPWFEIAPDSVKTPESEEAGKTRLLLKRQSDYLALALEGMLPTFSALTNEIVLQSMKILFNNEDIPKTHMQTCLIQSSTDNVIEKLKNYITNLLVVNHIGTDKEKIVLYAKAHVIPTMSIIKNAYCELFSKLSGQICIDLKPYFKNIGINDMNEWIEDQLIILLINISELRYSDFKKGKE